ncbi:hypothetical protein HYH03_004686 [Edaphochlamys debaryana]|uniref:Uncharacterized protein n=1 Tax=Edaphochlamys debaryana TaxID=47281 RepID=A0A836C1T0_9CHLO|nr:hypothetical protein HYH03_004686 [Edaphochlamys debaryana]|eukprot:KAG2497095.1 hypothetical protein HYH03_004686 [Edaphochlamys debaryana]
MPWPCGGKRSAEQTRVEVACPAQSWSGATEDSDGHVRPSPPGAGTRLVTKVVDSAGSLRHHHAPFPRLAGAFDVSGQVLRAASTSSTVRVHAVGWMQPGPCPGPVGPPPGWEWEAAGSCGNGSSHAAIEERDVLSELRRVALSESSGSPAPTAATPEVEWAAGWSGVEIYGPRSHLSPVPHISGPCGVGNATAGVVCADSDWDALQTWPGFEHEGTPVTPAAPLSASGAWPRSVAGALPTAAEPSGGGLTMGLQPPPLPPLGAAAAAAAALLPPRLASAPAAAWGLAAAAPSATDPRAQGPRQEPWASPSGSPYASYAAAHAASYPRLGRLLQPTPHAATAPALPWAQGPPLRAPASPWGPPYGADGWPQPSACSLPGVGSAPGPTKPRNPPVGAPWPFQPPWAHAAPAPVPPGAAALQAAQGPYTDPLGGGSDLGVPWDVTDDLDSVMLDAWLAMRSD